MKDTPLHWENLDDSYLRKHQDHVKILCESFLWKSLATYFVFSPTVYFTQGVHTLSEAKFPDNSMTQIKIP